MNRVRIILVGDSTVMSYAQALSPQAGWGEQLIRYFSDLEFSVHPSPGSSFSNAVCYESDAVVIDNRAMGARSVKTYTEEGRTADVLASLLPGDYLLMQFGHNDANGEKPDRYVPPEEFKERLLCDFITPARERGARPVLVTPLAMRVFNEAQVCEPSFPAYREAMLSLAGREKLPIIDLGGLSAAYNTRIGAEACKSLYLWIPTRVFPHWPEGSADDAHLQAGGAAIYAELVARELKRIILHAQSMAEQS